MRILLALETSGGGSGRHVVDLASALARLGHGVVVAYSPTRADPGFVDALRSSAIEAIVPVPMRRAPGPWDVLSLWRLWAAIRRFGPFDVIHGHSSKAGALVRLIPRGGRRCIYTPHAFRTMDPAISRLSRWIYGSAESLLSRWGNCTIITVSPEELEHAMTLGIPRCRLRMVANGIAPPPAYARGPVRDDLGIGRSDFCVGFVGRLVQQKAPERLIDALGHISSIHQHLKLVMIGEGEQEPRLRQRAAELGISDRVRILPGHSGQVYMNAFDLFVLPSRYEAMPYVLLEALAAGLPIVATRVGGAAAAVEDGVNGFLVDNVPDPAPLAEAIARYTGDETLRRAHAAASLMKFRRFGLNEMVDRTLRIYEGDRLETSGVDRVHAAAD